MKIHHALTETYINPADIKPVMLMNAISLVGHEMATLLFHLTLH